MCLDCGCGMSDQDWGDDKHITKVDIEKAAETNSTSINKVIDNMMATLQNMRKPVASGKR